MINNVIWEYSFSGGYVFSVFSLMEKLVNGFVIIQVSNEISHGDKFSINILNSSVPVICHVISFCMIWVMGLLSKPKFSGSDLYVLHNNNKDTQINPKHQNKVII